LKGEDFDEVGQALGKTEDKSVIYEYVHSLAPLNAPKAFDQVAFAMKDGELSLPVRTTYGYYLIKLHKQKTNT
jgi:peptidyl-prolyl cis-trans isomerase SurA